MLSLLLNSLKQANKLDLPVEKYTMLVNEKMETEGILSFIPLDKKQVKVLLPAPYHKDLLELSETFTYKNLLLHKEVIILK